MWTVLPCVRGRLLRLIPAAGILIDFAQVDVPFVPVDFLYSVKTRGHMLQLQSVYATHQFAVRGRRLVKSRVSCEAIDAARTAATA